MVKDVSGTVDPGSATVGTHIGAWEPQQEGWILGSPTGPGETQGKGSL